MPTRQTVRKKRNFKNLELEHSPVVNIELVSRKNPSIVCQCKCQDDLEYDADLALDLQKEDLDMREEIGSGSHGYVRRVFHEPTQTLMAMKTIFTRMLFPSPTYTTIHPTKSISSASSSASSLLDFGYLKTPPTPDTDGGFVSPTRSLSSTPPRRLSVTPPDKPPAGTNLAPPGQPCLSSCHAKDHSVDQRRQVRLQVLKEMKFLHACKSEHIVSYYGAFLNGDDVSLCMEFMDVGSLDSVYKKNGPIPIPILQKIALATVDGLHYLYTAHRIIHRDIKPSNILVNSAGQVKICDLGVSGQLTSSIANTFVGTGSYMSPERITGSSYSVKSDVWSLGITLMELAKGSFPFDSNGRSHSIFELLQSIVHEPPPVLPKDQFPEDLQCFVMQKCLVKDMKQRANLDDLLNTPYLTTARESKVDIAAWAKSLKSKAKE